MSNYHNVPQGRDPQLWTIAHKRVGFIKHATVYLIVNLFLWALWYFTGSENNRIDKNLSVPWPIWTTLGWGIGLSFKFANAYLLSSFMTTEGEYQKLINKKSAPLN